MKSARNVQDLASDAVRWQEDKYARRQQEQQQQFDAAMGLLIQKFEKSQCKKLDERYKVTVFSF